MIVDLYTDASIVSGRGAWAVVIVRQGEELVEASGPLRGSYLSSTATELAAVANGLHHAFKVGAISAGDEIRVWCDNEAAVIWANGTMRVKNKTDRRLLECRKFLREFLRARRLRIVARHIKGHQRLDSPDPRAIYNMRADQLCSAVRDGVEAPPFDALVGRIARAHARRKKREAQAA